MFERVQAFFDTYEISPANCKVLVAMSAGLDSMVLVDVLRKMGIEIGVAHMNYGLRGEDSEADEAFVRTYCETSVLPLHTRSVTLEQDGESIQMKARELRYTWFAELLSTFNYNYVATAHHLNDSLETTLLHLVKGTGLAGLTGIPEQNGYYIRPLSQVSRAEILAYAQAHDLQWREDASNAESKYQRNKIRNKVVPVLKEINPSVIDTFKHTLERLKGANALLEREVLGLKREYLKNDVNDTLSLRWFEKNVLGTTLLSELLKPYGVSYSLAKDIGRNHSAGASFRTETHQIVFDRNTLYISPLGNAPNEKLQIPAEGRYTWGHWTIELSCVGVLEFKKSDDPYVAYFDSANIDFPIVLRAWQEGDWFVPLGMTGKKKLSDFMIDHKIALTLKSQVPLFTTSRGIFWVGGYRIDDRHKVTENTKELLRIKLSHGV